MDVKKCGNCKQVKSLAEFGAHKYTKDGLNCWCRACCSAAKKAFHAKNREKSCAYTRANYRKNPDYSRGNQLKRKFWPHMTWQEALAEYDRLHTLQNGCCGICGSTVSSKSKVGKDRRLDVDHNHITGEVRGLLCNPCNHALGLLKADLGPDFAKLALDYITKSTTAPK